MALLRPREERPAFATRRSRTVVRCTLNGHQVGACRGLCEPSLEGDGLCGRPAPHSLIGRTQAAIARQRQEKAAGLAGLSREPVVPQG